MTGSQQLGRPVLCGSDKAHTRCKEQNTKDTVGKDLPDVMTTASTIYKIYRSNDQPDNA